MRDDLILIWGGTLRQGNDYIRKNELLRCKRGRQRVSAITPDDHHKVRGLRKILVIKVGTWFEHKHADEFTNQLLAQELLIVNGNY